jgi:hypothetical protein
MMTEEEILDLLQWTRTLLNGLGIGETAYYKNSVKELQDVRIYQYCLVFKD